MLDLLFCFVASRERLYIKCTLLEVTLVHIRRSKLWFRDELWKIGVQSSNDVGSHEQQRIIYFVNRYRLETFHENSSEAAMMIVDGFRRVPSS